jgi:signal transduction histidine kinase
MPTRPIRENSIDRNLEHPAKTPRDSNAWRKFKKHILPAASVFLVQSGVVALFALILKSRDGRDPTIRRLSRRLIQSGEDERRHIARELHDDIGQRLSLISIQLGALHRQSAVGAPDYRADLEDPLRELDQLITDVHNLSHSLHSTKLENLGLAAALEEVCSKISQRHGLDLELQSANVPDNLSPDTALCFYRVAQEALNNVVKHSGSSRALVCLAGQPDGLKMQVVDFGIGFDRNRAPVGLGLATMEERLLAISGTLSITSKRGSGTTVTAEVPVHRPRGPV